MIPFLLRGCGVLFFVAGILLWLMVSSCDLGFASSKPPTPQGKARTSGIVTHIEQPETAPKNTPRRHVTYSYTVDGAEYSSLAFVSFDWVGATPYAIGDTVTVLYLPHMPEAAGIEQPGRWTRRPTFILLGIVGVICLFGVAMFALATRAARKPLSPPVTPTA